jgi:hypothetical protein
MSLTFRECNATHLHHAIIAMPLPMQNFSFVVGDVIVRNAAPVVYLASITV